MTNSKKEYWTERYAKKQTGWDIGYPSTPLKTYIDQIEDKECKILIPGAGNAYEAEYLFQNGFKNVYVLDISSIPLQNLKKRIPEIPDTQLIHENFFEHKGNYDLVLEQTFFCSFYPSKENRKQYAQQMSALLSGHGLLVGVWFNHNLDRNRNGPPYGGHKEEYQSYLDSYFDVKVFEDCYNSIPSRSGNELFGIFMNKS